MRILISPLQDGVGVRGRVSLDRRLVRDLPEQGCELYFEGFKYFHPVDVIVEGRVIVEGHVIVESSVIVEGHVIVGGRDVE